MESKRQLKESYREVRTGWRARGDAKRRTGRFALVGQLGEPCLVLRRAVRPREVGADPARHPPP